MSTTLHPFSSQLRLYPDSPGIAEIRQEIIANAGDWIPFLGISGGIFLFSLLYGIWLWKRHKVPHSKSTRPHWFSLNLCFLLFFLFGVFSLRSYLLEVNQEIVLSFQSEQNFQAEAILEKWEKNQWEEIFSGTFTPTLTQPLEREKKYRITLFHPSGPTPWKEFNTTDKNVLFLMGSSDKKLSCLQQYPESKMGFLRCPPRESRQPGEYIVPEWRSQWKDRGKGRLLSVGVEIRTMEKLDPYFTRFRATLWEQKLIDGIYFISPQDQIRGYSDAVESIQKQWGPWASRIQLIWWIDGKIAPDWSLPQLNELKRTAGLDKGSFPTITALKTFVNNPPPGEDTYSDFRVGSVSTTTSEDGSQVPFWIYMTSPPLEPIKVELSSDDVSEGKVSLSSLSFNRNNWNIVRNFMVTGVDDFVVDGFQGFIVEIKPESTGLFSIKPIKVVLSNIDNDQAGFLLGELSGDTTEAGETAKFSLQLLSQPKADVVLPITTSDETEGVVSPSSVRFTSKNWNRKQWVTVKGVEDSLVDGKQQFTIRFDSATSLDFNFNGIFPVETLTGFNLDNDSPGIFVGKPIGVVTEGGENALFTVRLLSEPSANVTLPLVSSNQKEGRVKPSKIIFTPQNWDEEQEVSVIGVDDSEIDGENVFQVLFQPAKSRDRQFKGLQPSPSFLVFQNEDNDVPAGADNPIEEEEDGVKSFQRENSRISILLQSQEGDKSISDFLAICYDPTPNQAWTLQTLAHEVGIFSADCTLLYLELKKLTSLDLRGKLILDISPLREFTQIRSLDLGSNLIVDLSPLEAYTQLITLDLDSNLVIDISPLNGAELLSSLDLSQNPIIDLNPLTDLIQLTHLSLRQEKIDDERLARFVRLFKGLSHLVSLDLSRNEIINVSPLQELTQLTSLDLSWNRIEDLTSLQSSSQLLFLNLGGNRISDISPLRSLSLLSSLFLMENQIQDINSLQNLSQLTTLSLRQNQVLDPSPLRGLTLLTYLSLSENQIQDVSPLAGLTKLEFFSLGGNSVQELSALKDLLVFEKILVD